MILTTALASLALTLTSPQQEFCRGFEEGFRSVAGQNVIVPICPIAPIAAPNQTPYSLGIRQGVRAACQRYPNRC